MIPESTFKRVEKRGRERRKPLNSESMSRGPPLTHQGAQVLWGSSERLQNRCQEPPSQRQGGWSHQLPPGTGQRLLQGHELPSHSPDQRTPSGCKPQKGIGLGCLEVAIRISQEDLVKHQDPPRWCHARRVELRADFYF